MKDLKFKKDTISELNSENLSTINSGHNTLYVQLTTVIRDITNNIITQ